MLSSIVILSLLGALLSLIALCIIDLKISLLPNTYVLALALFGIAFHVASDFLYIRPLDLAGGAMIGVGLLMVVRMLATWLYRPDALGLGDVKLMGAAGIWLGPYYVLVALTVGAFAGILHGLGLAVYKRVRLNEPFDLNNLSLPAGPGFIVGVVVTWIYVFSGNLLNF